MPRARKHLVCLSETPYYHVTSRCVRRAFLCGVDRFSGRSYEHRRTWVEDRIRTLSSLFCVEICAYAVMSNHYHLVVRLQSEQNCNWSDDETLSRWTSLFRGPLLVQRYCAGESLTPVEFSAVGSMAKVYRARLHSLSWFMKCLNEPIARQANTEDGCTGHFWEARFHSQPLFSDKALLSAMAYVDLNPVRAGIAKKPEASDFTSIKARTQGDYLNQTLAGSVTRLLSSAELNHFKVSVRPLAPFSSRSRAASRSRALLPMYRRDYLLLVDLAGRAVRTGKYKGVRPGLKNTLARLGMTADEWLQAATDFRRYFRKGDLRLKKPA